MEVMLDGPPFSLKLKGVAAIILTAKAWRSLFC